MSGARSAPTSREIDAAGTPVVVVALGSWEQHGPHLPLDTDTRIADELVARVLRRVPNTVPGPTIGLSSSGEHAGFTGTLSIGRTVLTDTIVELVRSADWAHGIVVVNGHGGNLDALAVARSRLESEGRRILVWSPPLVDPCDTHAGYVETSLMLAIDPEAVRIEEIRPGPTPLLAHVLQDLRERGVIAVSPTGVLGDPVNSDVELGRRLLQEWEDLLVERVRTWCLETGTLPR